MTSPNTTLGVGIIGCGVISTTYLRNAPLFKGVTVRAIADVKPEAAQRQAQAFGVPAIALDEMWDRKDIDIIVNLTVPNAHYEVTSSALNAGKHVFSEKPIAVTAKEAAKLCDLADKKGLRLGVAPDTVLGPGHQLARRMIDEGKIGRITAGTATLMSRGMEHWHPDPTFFFKPGGGPVLDMGPYYITALVTMLGPVRRVVGLTGAGFKERIVTAAGPMQGKAITVDTPTTAFAVLQFEQGAIVSVNLSWDVYKHSNRPIELFGVEGSLRVPDPNFFGGVVETTVARGEWMAEDSQTMPMGKFNHQSMGVGPLIAANYRMLGVADMAAGIAHGKPHRATGRLALHATEVMEAILRTGDTGQAIEISGGVRPLALSDADARALLTDPQAVSGA